MQLLIKLETELSKGFSQYTDLIFSLFLTFISLSYNLFKVGEENAEHRKNPEDTQEKVIETIPPLPKQPPLFSHLLSVLLKPILFSNLGTVFWKGKLPPLLCMLLVYLHLSIFFGVLFH